MKKLTQGNGERRVVRIGVYYDGGFFHHVSNYYRYEHERKSRVSVPGLHDFIREKVAEVEGVDSLFAHIVEAHFFRGRFSAQQTLVRDKLYTERLFDDVLINEGVVTHFRQIQGNTESGIDVWLSLECFDNAVQGKYDVVVLIAGDSDFQVLIDKLNRLGVRVMLLGWDLEYTDDDGTVHQTTTSNKLVSSVTYPVPMHDIMSVPEGESALVDDMFVDQASQQIVKPTREEIEQMATSGALADSLGKFVEGNIWSIKDGFGFIQCDNFPSNVFFHYSALSNCEFNDLMEGDKVSFRIDMGAKGPIAKEITIIKDK